MPSRKVLRLASNPIPRVLVLDRQSYHRQAERLTFSRIRLTPKPDVLLIRPRNWLGGTYSRASGQMEATRTVGTCRTCTADSAWLLNRAVLAGLSLIAVRSWSVPRSSCFTSPRRFPAIAGFLILMYGVHLAWLKCSTNASQTGRPLTCEPSGGCGGVVHQALHHVVVDIREESASTSSISLNPSAQKSSGW